MYSHTHSMRNTLGTPTHARPTSSSATYRELQNESDSSTTLGNGNISNSFAAGSTPQQPNRKSVMYTRDWRSALRTPPTYRIGNRTVRFNYHFALLVGCVCALFVLFFYIRTGSSSSSDSAWLRQYISSTNWQNGVPTARSGSSSPLDDSSTPKYNDTYPLTPAVLGRSGGAITYRIGMVADLDVSSKVTSGDGSTVWRSFFKKGHLSYDSARAEVRVKWDDAEPLKLDTTFAAKGRGMELSELVTFDGRLLTFDDRTGLVYELVNDQPIPWVIMLDGNGRNAKGFKAEWASVKQHMLFVGSMGKEWTTGQGEYENENPMFVKAVTQGGEVRSLDWSPHYKRLREESQHITWPGYMIHESGVWSQHHQKWFFLPRRCSPLKYNETLDEHKGCNVLIAADEKFTKIETVLLDPANTKPTHGFSSFKFIPNTEDRIIVAIKSEELNGKTSTYITAFDIAGKTLLAEQRIDTDLKYEGFEFI